MKTPKTHGLRLIGHNPCNDSLLALDAKHELATSGLLLRGATSFLGAARRRATCGRIASHGCKASPVCTKPLHRSAQDRRSNNKHSSTPAVHYLLDIMKTLNLGSFSFSFSVTKFRKYKGCAKVARFGRNPFLFFLKKQYLNNKFQV